MFLFRGRSAFHVLVNFLTFFWMISNSNCLDLHEKTRKFICETLCGANTKRLSSCSCDSLLGDVLNNTLDLQQSLFCKSNDILAFKLESLGEDRHMYYFVEKKKRNGNWEYVTKEEIIGSTIFNVSALQGDTSYKIRTWVIYNNKIYAPMETVWYNTTPNNVEPLPVKELKSNYSFTENISYATIEWIPGDDLSCYYLLLYSNSKDFEYVYIDKSKTLFNMIIENIEYNDTYTISLKARNSYDLESAARNITMETPSCLTVYNNLSICVPEVPNDLKVEETPNSENFSYYNLKISWAKPQHVPDLYEIRFNSFSQNMSKDMNISGENTNVIIEGVSSQALYFITVRAWSSAGQSEPATYTAQVKSIPLKMSNVPIIWIVIGLLLLICTCTASSIFINRRIERNRRVQKRKQYFKDLEKKCPPSVNKMMYQYEMQEHLGDEWEIDPDDVTFHNVLGQGAFGVVKHGLLTKGKTQIEVAVKTLKSAPTMEELAHFQHELEIMKSVGSHPNLVSLIGVCIKESSGPLLVVEYCSKGDLQNYLKDIWRKIMSTSNTQTNSNGEVDRDAREFANKLYDMQPINLCNNELITSRELLSFARQIAKGMEYLSKLKILHRDLAARNVLICEDGTVKVSDFGLSRDVYRDNVYHKKAGGRLPIRWMAIESLTHQEYTTQSDVWSFGILLWEIVTLGGNPYPGIPTENLLKLLKAGYRMDCPINCKREIYDIMVDCWKTNPKDRLTFTEIRKVIEDLLENETEYLQVDVNACLQMNALQINTYKNVQCQKTLFQRYVTPIWRT